MREIFLLHDHDHFDLITTITGFHVSSYYYSACGVTTCHKERHNCGGTFRLCYRFNEKCVSKNSHGAMIAQEPLEILNVLRCTNS